MSPKSLKQRYTYDYPRPALTVDGVVLGLDPKSQLQVLLIERGNEPFQGQWALPGGFVDKMDESVDDAIRRELQEETGITGLFLEQLYTFGKPGRDPRERVVSVAYFALVRSNDLKPVAGDDAKAAGWFLTNDLPKLAFDHAEILKIALDRLRAKVRYQPIGFELLPEKFTLSKLQAMYESVLGKPLDKRNFVKKILSLDILNEVGKTKAVTKMAALYRFDKEKYKELTERGFNFEI